MKAAKAMIARASPALKIQNARVPRRPCFALCALTSLADMAWFSLGADDDLTDGRSQTRHDRTL
jgi:hypothetical protein